MKVTFEDLVKHFLKLEKGLLLVFTDKPTFCCNELSRFYDNSIYIKERNQFRNHLNAELRILNIRKPNVTEGWHSTKAHPIYIFNYGNIPEEINYSLRKINPLYSIELSEPV